MYINIQKILNTMSEIKGKNYTQSDLAEDLKVAGITITSWKKSKTYPNLSQLIKMKELCKFNSLDELL